MNDAGPEMMSLFLRALERSAAEERAAYLDAACGADAPLRERIEALLRAHEQAGGFLPENADTHGLRAADEPRTAEQPGAVLAGRYQLLAAIGEGGMGTVWRAQQQQPVKRIVAVKLIKPGMDTRQALARFEAERQALALTDHPNIAKVLDAGTAENGRPFFVMELVQGIPITAYCDEHRLTPRQRLELLVPVCQAVQHAHQKGIIHRDLKPSNVLTADYDGKAVPKVIDFGVAKATRQSLTEATLVTGIGLVVGTLEYMSPEQAEPNNLDIDTRTDVYSLGVLLYELLTGTTPLQRKRLKDAGLLEVLRIIREEETPRPSARLSTVEELPGIAACRGVEPGKLTGLVRGELDWIVLKCLEKDRDRRYETANALASDLQRYLNDEPVQACPPSAGYRLRKFARRNRGSVLAAAAVLLALVGAVVGTTWGLVHAEQARQDAETAEGKERGQRLLTARALAAERQALAEEKRARYLYGFHLAQREWAVNNLRRAEQLLDECPVTLRAWEWYYLKGLCRISPRTSLSHNQRVQAVAFSPDGRHLASSGGDGTVKIWDPESGKELLVFRGHSAEALDLAYSPDGRRLASASLDKTVKVWDAATGRELLTFRDHMHWVNRVTYSPNGRHIASAGYEEAVRIWDANTGAEVLTLPASSVCHSVAYSADGQHVAAGGAAGVVRVWDAATGRVVKTLVGGASGIRSLAYSPDGRNLASASGDGTMRIWDTTTWIARRGFRDFTGAARRVAYSPDGSRLASGGANGAVKVWDAKAGEELFRFPGHTSAVSRVAFSPDGRRLASADSRGTVKLWDAATAPLVVPFPERCSRVTFSPDSQRLAAGCSGGILRVWDAGTAREVFTLRGHTNSVTSVAYSPDGRRLVSAGSKALSPSRPTDSALSEGGKKISKFERWSGEVKVWDAATGQELLALDSGDPGDSGAARRTVYSVVYSPDGRRFAAISGLKVKVWDAATGVELLTLGPAAGVSSVAFAPDGRRLATTSYDKAVRVWDAATGQELRTLLGHTGMVLSVAYSPDGRRLATAGTDKSVKVWDEGTGQELWTFLGHTAGVQSVAFSPDGRRLVSGSSDGTVKILDAVTGEEFLTLRHQASGIAQLAFSPDGWRLAAVSYRAGLKVWDVSPSGQGREAEPRSKEASK